METIKDNKEMVQILDHANYLLRGRKSNWYIQTAVDKINKALKANNEEAIELLGTAKWLLRGRESNWNVQWAICEINKAIELLKSYDARGKTIST